jgi:hypothetical protein
MAVEGEKRVSKRRNGVYVGWKLCWREEEWGKDRAKGEKTKMCGEKVVDEVVNRSQYHESRW